ncbi:probable G-protein coupled receptor Mth-like 12 [Drosophila santomea]|uniref:probable G-protein coupled receptor Mth-like 12 n=1 Tax=Drosophila santomea TaxID=129105 RepID=UPI001953B3DF|nr:probable G-protein coupled receptor Mth-like 12 [Drosophila santomea]
MNTVFIPKSILTFRKPYGLLIEGASKSYFQEPPSVTAVMMISVVFYIITLTVYLFVKKLRNLLGKCLICYMFCLFVEYLIWTLDHFRLVLPICAAAGYIKYYFSLSSSLWISVVNFHLWKVLTSLNRDEPRYRFLIYNTLVWCMAAIPTGVIFSMNQMWENNPDKPERMLFLGYIGCSVTAIYIWKVRTEVKRFAQMDQSSTTCLEIDFPTYVRFLRLFLIMGAHWLFDQLAQTVNYYIMQDSIFMNLTVYVNASFGIIIFVLLILKSSTLKMIMESARGVKYAKT